MLAPVDAYTKGIHSKFKQIAAWPPNLPLKLGDLGILQGRLFQYRGTLKSMGIGFTHRAGTCADRDHSVGYHFDRGGNIEAQAVPGVPIGEAKAKLRFGSAGAFVFQAKDCQGYEIEDKIKLRAQIRALYEQGRWDPKWVVVEYIEKAKRATIIVANSNGEEMEVSARGGFPDTAVPLAGVEGGLKVLSGGLSCTKFLAKQGLTPLFGLLSLERDPGEILRDLFSRRDRSEQVEVQA